jgi:hypothetical protein
MAKLFQFLASAALALLSGAAYTAPIVSASLTDYAYSRGTVTQAPTTGAFILDNGFTAFGESAFFDGVDKFGISTSFAGNGEITYKNSFAYAGTAPSNIFYDFALDASTFLISDGRSEVTAEILVNGNRKYFGSISQVVVGFINPSRTQTVIGFEGFTPFAPLVGDLETLAISGISSIDLGLASAGDVFDLTYILTVATSTGNEAGGSASATDPGGFSANPAGRFRVESAVVNDVPTPSFYLLFAIGFIALCARRARKTSAY